MAEWRKLYGSMWRKNDVTGVSREARLLFVGIITLSDDEGYCEGSGRALKAGIFPADDDISVADVEVWRDELVTALVLTRYDIDTTSYVYLPGFANKQKIRRDTFKESNIKSRIGNADPVTPPLRLRNEPLRDRNVPLPRQTERETRQIDKRPAPSARPLEIEEDIPENPSTHFNYEGVLLGKLRAAWQLRFGGTQHPNVKTLLSRCRARDISPLTVLNYAKQHQPDDPLKYVQSLVKQGDGLWPDNGDETYAKWEDGIVGAICRNMDAGNKNPSAGI